MALASFGQASNPAFVANVAGPEQLSVRAVAEQFGRLFRKPVSLQATESADALLSNGQLGHRLFGPPRVGAASLVAWTADWLGRDGETLGKPTHFEVRDGNF
jgi:hypothetical protein